MSIFSLVRILSAAALLGYNSPVPVAVSASPPHRNVGGTSSPGAQVLAQDLPEGEGGGPPAQVPHRESESRSLMGTNVEVIVVADEDRAKDLIEEAFRRMEDLARTLSEWREDSEVSAVNRKAGEAPVRVGPDTLAVVTRSLRFSELSGGAFDITWAALRHIWDFSHTPPEPPPKSEVKRLLPLVDYRKVVVDQEASTIFLKDKGMEIGLGGVAKGYIIARAEDYLKAQGVAGGLISAGGNMVIWGTKENGAPWTIGIQDPRERGRLLGILRLTGGSVSTSGDYERFYIVHGKRYHHIIDPKTGFPARGAEEATVVCPSATDADALSKVVFILGPKKGLAIADTLKCPSLIVDSEGKTHMNDGMKKLLRGG